MLTTLQKKDWFHSDGFPIAVERREPQVPYGLHDHEFSEIVIVTGGRGQHLLGADSWELSSGDVFVIGDNRPHGYSDTEDLCLINVLFDQDNLEFQLHDMPTMPGYRALFRLEPEWRKRHQFRSRLRIAPHEMSQVMRLVEQLETELTHRETGFRFLGMATFMQIVGFLARCYGASSNADSRVLLRIARTITHIETHFAEPIALDGLVELSGMSRRSFLRDFEKATECTPIAYLIQIRINEAAKLLRSTTASVTEIAFQVGFNDSNYFARKFRDIMSLSPRQYRQQHL